MIKPVIRPGSVTYAHAHRRAAKRLEQQQLWRSVALFGVAVLARIHEHQLAGAPTTEQSEAAAAADLLPAPIGPPPFFDPFIEFPSDSDTTSDCDSIFEVDWSSDTDDQTA
ncbi:hypothetical protein ACI65C_004580 [Semiaphis heraclei]